MPFKRPAPVPESESSKRRRQSHSSSSILKKTLPNVKVYIVHAKLDAATLVELNALAEKHVEHVCRNAEDADVILTAVGMRKRLERHVPWSIAVSISSTELILRSPQLQCDEAVGVKYDLAFA